MDMQIVIVVILLLVCFGISFYCLYRYYQQRLKRELIRAQKSEQLKTVFLANISRALRSPLNAIVGYSNLILEEKDDSMHPAQVKEMAGHIKRDSKQLVEFIQQLLELSNFEGSMPSFTLIEVNLAELMTSYRREALNYTKPNVSIQLRTALSPHCKATLDTNFMHQLMMHLLVNAAKNTSAGDIIVCFGYERKGIRVTINYSGVGQAELIGEDIYSFLQKEDALLLNGDNSGLGLSICKAIIDALGGELDMNTDNSGRTTTAFWFPCGMRDKNK